MSKKPAIVIEVSGGVVSQITSSIDLDVYLLDYDNINDDPAEAQRAATPNSPDRVTSRSKLEAYVKENL
jgi:hypothetical protein